MNHLASHPYGYSKTHLADCFSIQYLPPREFECAQFESTKTASQGRKLHCVSNEKEVSRETKPSRIENRMLHVHRCRLWPRNVFRSRS